MYLLLCLSLLPASPGAQLGTGDGHTVVQSCALGDSHTGPSGIQQQGIMAVPVCRGSPNPCNYGKSDKTSK